ncbi:MAG: penicillin-binding protein 1B [Desulfobulbaceae bacterium]|nr:penicillin-binding protein 1B [Desulfobulbaceae bacterium]
MSPKKKTKKHRSLFSRVTIIFILIAAGCFALYVAYLDKVILRKFDGKRWTLPAVVYARPLELYAGLSLSPNQLIKELKLAGYRNEKQKLTPGGYSQTAETVHLVTRDFYFPEGLQRSMNISVTFSGNKIKNISRTDSGENVSIARLDPARIGSFHPKQHHEDRIVLTYAELPEQLIKTLLAVEDQNFYSHRGLSPKSIARALWANIRAGKTVQGGSTLTQQLVKNFFLSNQRTLRRKFNEAIMTLLLEAHYSKQEILTAYANEIFLGQDGARAVHGFGLASQFYFKRDLKDLSASQTALLVGMIKGPSYFDPRRHPKRAQSRRQLVLSIMRDRSIIDDNTLQQALASSLKESTMTTSGFNRFPAFLDLVRRQLRNDYREEDLTNDGMRILTTLDPHVQWQVEEHLGESLKNLRQSTGNKDLEGAVIVSSRESAEILAVAGGSRPLQASFNRALDASRQVGSLIKPALYLSALENKYTLATAVDDRSITLTNQGEKNWKPQNFDRKEHGRVALYQALAQSYNLATVRVGLDVGVKKIIQTVNKLGIDRAFPPYPSFLLGASSMSPIEVSQMYQTMATGGFYIPQRAINCVFASDNTLLNRFGLSVEQRFTPESMYLLNTALQHVVSEGTGKTLSRFIPASFKIAGKTGTSNDLRDSWFAGFSHDKLAVVWLGRDKNKPSGLTGASGALVAWAKIMRSLSLKPLQLTEPPGILWSYVNPVTLEKSNRFHPQSIKLPFLQGTSPNPINSEPRPPYNQLKKPIKSFLEKLRSLFN